MSGLVSFQTGFSELFYCNISDGRWWGPNVCVVLDDGLPELVAWPVKFFLPTYDIVSLLKLIVGCEER